MTTAIVIPTFNRCATVILALRSIFKNLPLNHQVVVVDAGSSGTAAAIENDFPQALLLQGNSSLWWAAATNLGIQKAKELGCDYVLTYNDDNVVTPKLFASLSQAAAKAPDSIISAVCCYADKSDVVFFAGRRRAKGTDRFYYLDHDTPLSALDSGLRTVDMLHGMCTLFPMTVFDRVGLFNERVFPQLFADDDLLMRAKHAGFSLQVALDAVVLNDRTKTGNNPYDHRLGPRGILSIIGFAQIHLSAFREEPFSLAPPSKFFLFLQNVAFRLCTTFDRCVRSLAASCQGLSLGRSSLEPTTP